MDITTQRRCLSTISGVLLVGTVAAIAWSFSTIDTSSPLTDAGRKERAEPAKPANVDVPPLDQRIASRSLRGPLYDPPPPQARPKPEPVPAAAPPRQPQLDLTLVGTIIEENESVAILSDASGQFDIKGIGESLELVPAGVTVESIESEQVTLQYQGHQSTIQLNRSFKKSGAKAPRGNPPGHAACAGARASAHAGRDPRAGIDPRPTGGRGQRARGIE